MSTFLRRATALGGAAALIGAIFVPASAVFAASTLPAAAVSSETVVAAMTSPLYRVYNNTGNSFLTPNLTEARAALGRDGFFGYEVAFYASAKQVPGSEPVYRLRHQVNGTYLHTAYASEVESSKQWGYVSEGPAFYVPAWDMPGTEQVYRMHKIVDRRWRYKDIIASDLARDEGRGWIRDGRTYRVVTSLNATPTPPVTPQTDGVFTFVQFPDTQVDVFPETRSRFTARVNWVLNNKKSEGIRFVGHTGDIVNYWETATNNAQYKVAPQVMAPLIASDIPFAAAVGNHDTLAVADGAGWANTDANGNSLAIWGLRQTALINQAFPSSSFKNMRGQMEAGKFDNSFHTFEAEGADFLVLSLELYPRQAALDWAKGVLAKYPNHNVIILTHHYMNADGAVGTSKEYGATAPSEIERQLVNAYPNVKMVLSGHTGETVNRVHTTPKGGTVLYSLTNLHYDTQGPVRAFKIDVKKDQVSSEVVRTVSGERGLHTIDASIDWIE